LIIPAKGLIADGRTAAARGHRRKEARAKDDRRRAFDRVRAADYRARKKARDLMPP